MARDYTQESRVTLASGRKGMIVGALAGGLFFALFALVMDLVFHIGTGGPGINFIAGAAVGGLAGTLIGAIRGSHHSRLVYHGPERRSNQVFFRGAERRIYR